MSFEALAWAVRQKLPCTQKIVLVMLADRHNGDTGRCDPSHDRLAGDCGLTRRSVMDQIEKLVIAGYLRVIHRSVGKLKTSNQYTLMLGFGAKPDVKEFHIDAQQVPVVVNVVPSGSEPDAHKPVIEPVKEPKEKARAKAPSLFIIPEWINRAHWDAWHSIPKRKNATPEQKQLAVDKLKAWKEQGIDHAAALENAAVGGWQGLFKPDDKRPPAVITGSRAPQAESFAERDARNKREKWERETGRQWPANELPSSARSARPLTIVIDENSAKRIA